MILQKMHGLHGCASSVANSDAIAGKLRSEAGGLSIKASKTSTIFVSPEDSCIKSKKHLTVSSRSPSGQVNFDFAHNEREKRVWRSF